MSEYAVRIRDLGRMYKLYNSPRAQLLDTLGFGFMARNSFKEFWALRHFDLDVRHGERVGLIGRNGAGKSTLLKILCGRSHPTEGNFTLDGEVQALLGIGTGFNQEFTGRENIYSALSLNGLSPKQIKHHEEEIIDFTELDDFINQPVKYYSAGMYTRLAFAVATALEPEILIIDEVLGAGDAAFVSKCAARMKRITEDSGATVLYVSHSTPSVIEICNRAILIERGHIAADGDPLAISKLYHQRVRAEEEVSLKAREYRVRRRDLKNLLSTSDRRKFLFRLSANKPHPDAKHKIREARLRNAQDEVVARLAFGAPHDNSEVLENHVLDGYGLNDWGPARKDMRGTYRLYEDVAGRFCHAPFQLSAGLHEEPGTLTLEMDAEPVDGEPVNVDWFDGTAYRTLGILSERFTAPMPAISEAELQAAKERKAAAEEELEDATAGTDAEARAELDDPDAVPLAEADAVAEEPSDGTAAQAVDDASLYGSGEVQFKAVALGGTRSRDQRVFETGERMVFTLTLEALQPIPSFTLVVCIYLRDGRPGAQVHVSSTDLGLDNLTGRARVEAVMDPLRLGAGEYMVSIGVFKTYDLTTPREDPAYVVLDRGVFFSVAQPASMQKSVGGFAHPVLWRSTKRAHRYDPADWFTGNAALMGAATTSRELA